MTPLSQTLNAGQIYVTLTLLEKAGLAVQVREENGGTRPDRVGMR
ncbi:hypothetical protein [Streptomyces daliensis]